MKRLGALFLVLAACGLARGQYIPIRNGIVYQAAEPSAPFTCFYGTSPVIWVTATGCGWYCDATNHYVAAPCGGEATSAVGVDGDVQVYASGVLGTIAGLRANPSTGRLSANSLNFPITTTANGILYANGIPWAHNFSGLFGYTGSGADTSAEARNVFLGIGAGNFTITSSASHEGRESVGIGHYALHNFTTGYQDIGIGRDALRDCTSCRYNMAQGSGAFQSLTVGELNTGVGSGVGVNAINSTNLTLLGADAGYTVTTGDLSTLVGSSATTTTGTIDNAIALGYNVQVDAAKKAVIGNTNVEASFVCTGSGTPLT
jgi:hypothetical protein